MKRCLFALAALVTMCGAERAASACSRQCEPQPLSYEGKLLPSPLAALPLGAGAGSSGSEADKIELRRGDEKIAFTIVPSSVSTPFGLLQPAKALEPGDYTLVYPQACATTPDRLGRAVFSIGAERALPTTTGAMSVVVRFVPKTREAPEETFGDTCSSGADLRDTYDRVVAEVTLKSAPDLVPFLPVTGFDVTTVIPSGTGMSGTPAGFVKEVQTWEAEVRCDDLRSRGALGPGKYSYSYAARLPGGAALPPASVDFEMVCPASTKTPVYGTDGQPIPQDDVAGQDGCSAATRGRAGGGTIASTTLALLVATVLVARRRRARRPIG